MANCDDLNQQLAEIDAQLAELDRLEGLAKARIANRSMVGTGKALNNLRDLNGRRIAASSFMMPSCTRRSGCDPSTSRSSPARATWSSSSAACPPRTCCAR